MKESFRAGMSFGITSAIITILGLMMGLYKTTSSKVIIISGILTIAIADSLSDSLGIHLEEESRKKSNPKSVWETTIATFVSKFVVAALFIIPFFFFQLKLAIIINTVLGFILLILFTYKIAIVRGEKPLKPMFEHLSIAVLVLILTWFTGKLVGMYLLG
ncbi:hypothetical protein HN747_01990 [archaeon]|nr:hypothetical protein [archaeon]